jgi:hypothetical protein
VKITTKNLLSSIGDNIFMVIQEGIEIVMREKWPEKIIPLLWSG